MADLKGLIQHIDEKCYGYYKNDMSVEEIAIEMNIPELLVIKAIAREKAKENSMNNLIKQVEQWSIDKGLDKGNSFTQYAKSSEEMGEVAAALCRNDIDELRDGIGDVIVTLVILAQQNNMTLYECLEQAYGEIKNRTGVMSKDGSFIKSEDL